MLDQGYLIPLKQIPSHKSPTCDWPLQIPSSAEAKSPVLGEFVRGFKNQVLLDLNFTPKSKQQANPEFHSGSNNKRDFDQLPRFHIFVLSLPRVVVGDGGGDRKTGGRMDSYQIFHLDFQVSHFCPFPT